MNEIAIPGSGDVSLPQYYDDKWPRLIVVGERITPAQAEQVIVRTDSGYLHCNDREWEKAARKIMGLYDFMEDRDESRLDERGYIPSGINREREARTALGMLELHYLHNTQIAGAWLGGGTQGWCHWDGRVGSANWNIGKWPSVEEVTEDWKEIAKIFPFLDLRCQVASLCDDDLILGDPQVWGTWTVKGGKVHFNGQEKTLLELPKGEATGYTMSGMFEVISMGGRKMTLEALAAVIERVKRTLPDAERKALT